MSGEQRVTDERLALSDCLIKGFHRMADAFDCHGERKEPLDLNAVFQDLRLAANAIRALLREEEAREAAHRATEAELTAALAEMAAWKSRFTTLPEGYEISDDATVPLAIELTSQAMQLDHAREQITVLCQQNTQWEAARDSWAEQLTTAESALAATKAKLEAVVKHAWENMHSMHCDDLDGDDPDRRLTLQEAAKIWPLTYGPLADALTTQEKTDER